MATIRLTLDFSEFLKLCNEEKIKYLVVGGYAVAFHGVVRPTKDLDVWIALDPSNLDRVIVALEKFGFAQGSINHGMFLGKESIFRMGFPPNRLELFTRIIGVGFDECYARRQIVNHDGIDISVISLNDLIVAKTATARAQDLADVAKLQKVHHSKLTPPPP